MNRREVLKSAAGAVMGLGLMSVLKGQDAAAAEVSASDKGSAKGGAGLKKAFVFSMLPGSLSIDDRFKMAKDVGLDGVEISPADDPEQMKSLRNASEKTGIQIHSIIYGGWGSILSSPDPAVAERSKEEIKSALKCAKEVGADNVLLVPAIVNAETRYIDAYQRSQKHIRTLLPEAEKQKVCITVENVWNNFLLSPVEFARYVDEFKSPYLKAYFDVGNVVVFGWPEDWIRTLGPRIKKVHLKDFKRDNRSFCNLREGDVNWPEVRKALTEVGYNGYVTSELGGGDEAYLRDVSQRMDKIVAGE